MRRLNSAWLLLFLSALGAVTAPAARAVPNFATERTVLLSTGSPQQIIEHFGTYRLYFVRDGFTVHSATSSDRMNWSVEAGVRLSTGIAPGLDASSITHVNVMTMPTTGYRMLYSAESSTGIFTVLSATSTDGLTWYKEDKIRLWISSGTTRVRSPRTINPSNGLWRMFFVQDTGGGNFDIRSATSTDAGQIWSLDAGTRVTGAFSELSVSTLTDGRTRLIYSALASGTTVSRSLGAALSLSTNSLTFVDEGVFYSTPATSGEAGFPLVARTSETFRHRIYFGYKSVNSTVTVMHSMLSVAPDIESFSISSASVSDAAFTATLKGEVFGTTPTVTLARGVNTLPVSGMTRNSDQSLSFTVNPFNAAEGTYTLTVTNPDSSTDTINAAIAINVPGGEMTLTDNLFRPRNGTSVTVSAQAFAAGRVSIRVYDIAGRLVRTLFDEDRAAGTTTVSWDGGTDSGKAAVSGVYLIHASGPRLDITKKAVLIR